MVLSLVLDRVTAHPPINCVSLSTSPNLLSVCEICVLCVLEVPSEFKALLSLSTLQRRREHHRTLEITETGKR